MDFLSYALKTSLIVNFKETILDIYTLLTSGSHKPCHTFETKLHTNTNL